MSPKSFEVSLMSRIYVVIMKWILVAFSIIILNWYVLMLILPRVLVELVYIDGDCLTHSKTAVSCPF